MQQPPHRSTLLTRPQQQDRRHMQWGVTSPPDSSYLQRPYSKGSDHLFTNDKRTYLGEEVKPYYGEQSQVNTTQGGFKKLKFNQIEMLKELKKQYDVLRNSSLDSRVFLNKKLTSESESNLDENSASNSEYQPSVKSKTGRSVSRRKSGGKELKLVVLQKKQLEIMLNNSMKKIQELLHNQIQLKRTVLELKGKLESGRGSQSQYETTFRKYKESEEGLNRQLEDLRKENETLRGKIKELTISAGNVQGAASIKQLQLRKKDDKIRLCEQQIQLERNRYKSLELDLKKVRMEYELLEKSKSEEIGQLAKMQGSMEESWKSESSSKIRKLEEELAVKEQRYALLLAKMSSSEAEQKKQEEREYTQNLQKLIGSLQEQKNHQNSEAIAVVLTKLNEMHTPDQRLLQELSLLKKELQVVKTSQSTQKESYSLGLEQKIRQLQKVIDQQNMEKGYFMQDLKKLTQDFNQVKRDREEVMRQNKELKYILDRLEAENKKYRSDLDQIKNVPVDLTESQIQNKELVAKLHLFNYKEVQLATARQEISKLNEQTRAKTQAYEEEVRLLKRQLNEEEFKVFKGHQEHQLKLSLLKIEHQAQITRLQEELDRAHKNYALEKSHIENRKIQLQTKLLEKDKEMEERSSAVVSDSKENENYLQKAQADYSQRTKELQDRHALQTGGLMAKLQAFAESHEKYVRLGSQYAQAEQQIAQLKKAVRMGRRMTEGLDHLWQIKETEYSNINDVLKSLEL